MTLSFSARLLELILYNNSLMHQQFVVLSMHEIQSDLFYRLMLACKITYTFGLPLSIRYFSIKDL